MAEHELPTFDIWLQNQTQTGIPSALFEEEDVVGAEVIYTHFERVPSNMVHDKPVFDAYVARKKEEVVSRARAQSTTVKGVRAAVLKPEHLRIGDREEMFPQHAKFTTLVYFFGYTYNDDEQPVRESTEV